MIEHGSAAVVAVAATCQVCGESGQHRLHQASERMFGLEGSFTYRECSICGTLSLTDAPASLSSYYPSDYYSLAEPGEAEPAGIVASIGRRWLMRLVLRSKLVARAVAIGGSLVGLRVEPWTRLLGGTCLGIDARVLDVGCGDGHRLRTFRRFGFCRLVGIDANLPRDEIEVDGVVLSRATLGQVEGPFDLVMFHHSFEHMGEPVKVLADVHRLLRPGGSLLIRVPLAGSWAWRTYGVDWVQLDAPRHLYLYTAAGLDLLAGRSGFELRDLVYDSGSFQFWGSESYRGGTSLQLSGSVDGAAPPTLHPRKVKEWERRARKLNVARDGDQAAFLFAKPEGSKEPLGGRRP